MIKLAFLFTVKSSRATWEDNQLEKNVDQSHQAMLKFPQFDVSTNQSNESVHWARKNIS